jgi:hypothetical protein
MAFDLRRPYYPDRFIDVARETSCSEITKWDKKIFFTFIKRQVYIDGHENLFCNHATMGSKQAPAMPEDCPNASRHQCTTLVQLDVYGAVAIRGHVIHILHSSHAIRWQMLSTVWHEHSVSVPVRCNQSGERSENVIF